VACAAEGKGADEAGARAWIDMQLRRQTDGAGLSLAIAEASSGDALGCISLNARPRPGVAPAGGPSEGRLAFETQAGTAGIGYWVLARARRRGLATSAVRLLTRWAIAEGYIPSESTGEGPELESHEAACLLNASGDHAEVEITVFFEDRQPAGPYRLTVPALRTLHLRFNDLEDPEPIPRDTSYAAVIESDQPIVVQHTRLDSRQPALALLSTVAHPA